MDFPGVDIVADLARRWPFEDGSVSEVYCAHCIEHFDAIERVHFVNELYRVLKVGAQATLITPHWCSHRAYGDPTHKWPPVSEMWFFYLKREWRLGNPDGKPPLDPQAPHTDRKYWDKGFDCDFDATWGYGLSPIVCQRGVDFQTFAMNHYKEAATDIHATLTKRG